LDRIVLLLYGYIVVLQSTDSQQYNHEAIKQLYKFNFVHLLN